MSLTDIPVTLAEGKILQGADPIVIIGPNGSGKTQFAVNLANKYGAEFIGALRNIALDGISMQPLEQAAQQLSNQLSSQRSQYWSLSNEISSLFSKLLAEDSASAIRLRDAILDGQPPNREDIERTRLHTLRAAWKEFFPGRDIRLETYSPVVQSNISGATVTYPARQMSDGERVALYLGARVLNAQPGLIIIDEPEIHFHSRLSARFWNAMQNLRPDLRFVYSTHDLTFALSRKNARFVIIRSNQVPEIVPQTNGLPNDLAESILGAASFSIYASRVIFCEGDESSDYSFYTSWFNAPNTAVIPVGGCKEVIQCATVFSQQPVITGVAATGIIDRDYWPDNYFSSLPVFVTPLAVHELENLYCIPQVFTAVGQHLSKPEIGKLYDESIIQSKARFTGGLLTKQIVERFKRRCSGAFDTVVNNLPKTENVASLESQFAVSLQPGNWGFDPLSILREERGLLENALSSTNPMAFLALFPGKSFISFFAKSLGIETATYKGLINSALIADNNSALSGLKNSLEDALSGMLPPR